MLLPSSTASAPRQPLTPIGVLVIDDQAAVREGLARLIACAPLSFRAVTSVGTGAEAMQTVAWLRPEVVVLDVDLAGEDGLALISRLGSAAVLVLTCHGDPATRERAARLGAGAFIEKHQPASELLGALVRLATQRMGGELCPSPQGTDTHESGGGSSGAHAALRP